MILKKITYILFLLSFLFLSCKSDNEKEIEKIKKLTISLRSEKLPSYDSLYSQIINQRISSTSQDLIVDSLYQTTQKITNLIDSLIKEVEKSDSNGESRKIGNSFLVTSLAGINLTKGAKAINQYCIKVINDKDKKNILNKRFSKYNGYLGSIEFNEVYFSKSSSSFIIMILIGLKNDLIKATYLALTEIK